MKRFAILIIFTTHICLLASAFEYKCKNPKSKSTIRKHSESSYKHAWCSAHNGTEEYKNKDKTRIDCLTNTHAVEFDFANKWAEGIGQALHYQYMTGKRGMVVLILEEPKKEMIYYKRVKNLGQIYNFDTEYITQEILNAKNGKCSYSDCKCNKK